MTMKKKLIASFAMIVFTSMTGVAQVPPPPGPGTKVGVLNCRIAPSVGLIIVGVQRMSCRFSPDTVGLVESYVGTLNTVGVDLGFTSGGAMAWAVFAPTNQMVPGSLSGTYVGASGNVGFGVGVGENFLLGGSNNSIALQPWSVEGTTGVNISGGVSSLELRAEP
jgi:hypothetical protein